MALANTIIDLRKERDISQKSLADSIGVSQSAIAKIELGKNEATASTLVKLANFFNVSIDYLTGLSPRIEDSIFSPKEKSPTVELTAEEKNLIKIYRKLNMKNKIHVETYAQIRLDEQDPTEQKNPRGVYTTGRR